MFHFPFKHKSHKTSAEIVLKKKLECLILIGDSILDNFYWIDEHNKDIEYQIVQTLKKTYNNKHKNDNKFILDNDISALSSLIRIHNLSLDSIDISGILTGHLPNPLYVRARKTFKLPTYPLDIKDNKLYPIKLLSSMCMNKEIKINKKNKDKNHINPTVILSVASNDLRRNLKYGRPALILEALRKENFAQNYEKIVNLCVKNLGLNLIIIIPYEPHESFTEEELHFSRDDLLACMEFITSKICQIGEKYQCPIIDLSQTLNPFDRSDYGTTAIEISRKSGQYLVNLIIKILATWDWTDANRKSKLYYGIKKVVINTNTNTNATTNINPLNVSNSNNNNNLNAQGIQTCINDITFRQGYFHTLQNRALLLDTSNQNAQEMDLLADLFSDQKDNDNDNNNDINK